MDEQTPIQKDRQADGRTDTYPRKGWTMLMSSLREMTSELKRIRQRRKLLYTSLWRSAFRTWHQHTRYNVQHSAIRRQKSRPQKCKFTALTVIKHTLQMFTTYTLQCTTQRITTTEIPTAEMQNHCANSCKTHTSNVKCLYSCCVYPRELYVLL